MYKRSQYNAAQFNAAAEVSAYADTLGEPYQLELHEANGDLVWTLPYWYGATWTQRVNEPDYLQFTYPDDGTGRIDAFTFGREVWLYQGDATNPAQKFIVAGKTLNEVTGQTITIRAQSLMYGLGLEQVASYAPGSGETVLETVTALLALQVRDNPIKLGNIDDAIGTLAWNVGFEVMSLLACLNKMRQYIGGYWWVDSARYFHWQRRRGDQSGRFDIRLGRNCTSIARTTNDEDLANRIIAYGAGETEEERVTVTVNDTDSQTTYGIRTAFFSDKRIKDVTVLQSYAEAELYRRSTPRTTYEIGVLDLSRTDTYDYSFEADALQVGSIVRLLGGDSGIDVTAQVHMVERQLDDPMAVRIAVGNPDAADTDGGDATTRDTLPRDLADLFSDWKDRQIEGDTGVFDELARRLADDPQASGASAITVALHEGVRDAVGWAVQRDQTVRESVLDAINTTMGESDGSGETRRADFDDTVAEAVTRVLNGAGGSGSVKETLIESIQTAAGAGGSVVETVAALPAIPLSGMQEVFWSSTVSGGNGDDQVWRAYAGQSAWTPTQRTTTLSGTP